ncbi:MAG: hypothetical protein EOP82_19810 [Variovorax sp.]|nr:MAG: hypothetical protein EOP82_19810 [Variovorax sp.]
MTVSKENAAPRAHRGALAALAAALAMSFGAMPQASADGLKCRIDLYAKNRTPASIKVTRFEYTVRGNTYTEGLANKRVAPGEEVDWDKVSLQHAAIGNVITSTRVEYKEDTSGVGSPIGDPYGPPKWSAPHTHTSNYPCATDRNYAHYID